MVVVERHADELEGSVAGLDRAAVGGSTQTAAAGERAVSSSAAGAAVSTGALRNAEATVGAEAAEGVGATRAAVPAGTALARGRRVAIEVTVGDDDRSAGRVDRSARGR